MKVLKRFLNKSSPLMFFVTTSISTRAPLPLSKIAAILGYEVIVPSVGIGRYNSRYCSPCSSMARLKSIPSMPTMLKRAPKGGITP